MNFTYARMQAGYRNMWRSMTIKPGRDDTNAAVAAHLIVANEKRYRAVEAKTGVPWFWIGAIHYREASNSFAGVLHNGEHIIGTGRKTHLVPAGRGPFATWEDAAIDALEMHGLQKIGSWPIERMGYEAERYNGWGYAGKGVNSPYVWAGTNHEQTGAYVADHAFDRTKDDPRVGTMAIWKKLSEMRPDVLAALSDTASKPAVGSALAGSTGAVASGAAAAVVAAKQGMPFWQIVLVTTAIAVAVAIVVHFVGKKG